jgi:hypothetical protein
MAIIYNICNGSKIGLTAIKFTSFSHCKTLQNFFPNLDFWSENIPSGSTGRKFFTQEPSSVLFPHRDIKDFSEENGGKKISSKKAVSQGD